jgi:TRAP-type C4-dicarboxylate transport system permease small subunit
MIALILGILFIAFTVFSVLPSMPLNWGENVIYFLKGSLPVFSAFIGLIAILIGFADIKDKSEAKKEEAEAAKNN